MSFNKTIKKLKQKFENISFLIVSFLETLKCFFKLFIV